MEADTRVEAVTINKATKSRPWQVALLVALASFIAVYWQTFRWWWGAWTMEESYYSHAVLIPFMSVFVVYINRKTLAKVALKPSMWGLAVLVPAVMLEMLAYLGNSATSTGLTLPFVVFGAVLLLFGVEMTRHLLFPVWFLSFMCVLPGFLLTKLSFKIQMLSTTAATHILNLLQFHAQQTGAQITLPNIEVMVGAPCSGFRMLISLLAFTVFFAYMKEGPRWGRLTLIALTVPLSLIANSTRVALIAIWGEFFGEESMKVFHDYSGFIVLFVSFVILWWLAKVVKCDKFRSMLLS